MNSNFYNMLNGLNSTSKIEAVKLIMSKYKEQTAIDSNFYSNPVSLKRTKEQIFDKISTNDVYIEHLINIEAETPYSIFKFILLEEYSDIMFFKDGYKLTGGKTEEHEDQYHVIPESLLDIYKLFFNHFIENVMFLANSKFDPGNALLDTEVGNLRFHMVHSSLNVDDSPVMVVRKQIIKKTINMSDEYLDSTGCSEKQKEIVKKYSKEGNTIVFGQVGSGKTTMLKFIGNHDIENKKNLITLEDTKELGIDVPIALLTNNNYKIKDLFTAALRENPSHIIVGETRTDEIIDILEAGLTISTATSVHANSFARVIQRIIFMSMARGIPVSEVEKLITATVDCFIFMDNKKVKEIHVHKGDYKLGVYDAYEKVL